MNGKERFERYARLAVEVGVNLAPGQDLLVNAEVKHAPLVRCVARSRFWPIPTSGSSRGSTRRGSRRPARRR